MKQALQKRRCWLLPLVATLLWTACSGSGDDDAVQTPVPSGQQLTASYHITLLTANVLTSTDGVRSGNTWFFPVGRGEKAVVYAKQDDRLTYIGQLTFKQDGLREYRIDSIDVQGRIDLDKPFELYGGTMRSGTSWEVSGSDLYCNTTLTRTAQGCIALKAQGTGSTVKGESSLPSTREVLFIANMTDKAVSFKHKGFDAPKKWYYAQAGVGIGSGDVQVKVADGEAESNILTLQPYASGTPAPTIASFYVPNGERMSDAQLVAEIDGREVRSVNRFSSDVELQTGHSYGIVAVWDGEKLVIGRPQGESVIELPEGAAIDHDDISVIADGQRVELNADGTFDTDASAVMAFGKNDRLLYVNLLSTDDGQQQRSVELNATQTAVTMLLAMFPNIFEPAAGTDFQDIKTLIADLPETQALATAIDQSIVAHGYFEANDVSTPYRTAIDRIKQLLGLDATYMSHTTPSATRRNKARLPQYAGKSYRRQGFRIDVDHSQWDAIKAMWNLEFTAYNERWGYMAVNVADVMPDGTQFPLYDGLEVLQYVVKPMSPKSFVGKFSSWEGLKTYFAETWQYATDPDFQVGDMTFDMQKLSGIKLAFGMPSVQLQIIAPKDNGYLLTYSVVMNTTKPILAFLGSTVSKVFEDYYMQEYVKSLVTPAMIEKTVRAIREGKKAELAQVVDQVLSHLRSTLLKIPADLPNLVSDFAVDDLGMALKDTMFFLKMIQETMEVVSSYGGYVMGSTELIDLGLTFEDYNNGGTIVDVPGSNF